jgi:hypothetical protein
LSPVTPFCASRKTPTTPRPGNSARCDGVSPFLGPVVMTGSPG